MASHAISMRCVNSLTAVRGEASEHIVYLASAGKVVAYAEAQARVGGRAEHLGDVLQPVVARTEPDGLKAYRSERRAMSTSTSMWLLSMPSFSFQ